MMKKNKNQLNEPTASYGQPLSFEKVWLMFQEVAKQFKENEKRIKETGKQIQETGKQMKETDKKLKRLEALFTGQWGKLIESLVEGDLIALLKKRGVHVNRTIQRVSGSFQGNPYEFDIIAVNGKEIVIVEVKTTFRVDDVKHFLEKLSHAKTWMTEYKDKTVYGAVAYLTSNAASHIMAEKQGLFVIKATGNSAFIANKTDFNPKEF